MNILIMGMGYVGVTTGIMLSDIGNRVTGYDPNEERLNALIAGKLPFHEPGIAKRLKKHLQSGKIAFTADVEKGILDNQMIFICVGTPSGADGSANLEYLQQAAESIGRAMHQYTLVVVKSTVPVGTQEKVKKWIMGAQPAPCPFDVASNPEFLREGTALYDAHHPDRIVLGCDSDSPTAVKWLKKLYKDASCPILVTEPKTAEMIKYASNAFLATKISYINELARLCDRIGVDVDDVAKGMGLDHRIGAFFLNSGIGYGGSCFPKDIQALLHFGKEYGSELSILADVARVNRTQYQYALEQWETLIGTFADATVAVLGLSFKKDTDDMREAPSLPVIAALLEKGALVQAYDPAARLPAAMLTERVRQLDDMEEAVRQADAVIICSDWQQFKDADWARLRMLMRRPFLFDGKNMLNGKEMSGIGFHYKGIGV